MTVNHIARWNGAGWFALGSGLGDSAAAVEVLPGDHVVAAGDFMTAGGTFSPAVARWNGSSWLAQSTPALAWDFSAGALLALPNGDYFAAGTTSTFGLVGIDANVARHTAGAASQQWTTADLRGLVVGAAARLPNGDLVFGGEFDGAGGRASHNLAVLRPTCPAAVASYGSSCAGSGGANVLTATAPAWTGSTFHSLATGMPANGIAIAVTGFAPLGVPMATVLPQGLPGCTLLASPDSLVASLPIGGVVTAHVALPNTPALGGQSFYHQVAALDFDLAGNLVAVTGTNGLMLTIGVL